jgi:Cys-tRNA(Pro)/Cys-tRNA(Cys) deacylase
VATKTNAMRLLEQMGIAYEARDYEVDEQDLSAETVARKIGLAEEQVFKTLVVRGDTNGLAFAVIGANMELDLKALARARGDRKIDIVPLKDVLPLTGYIRGGVTAIGAKKEYPVVIDELAQLFEVISISAGQRGTQLLLNPLDYARAVNAIFAPIARFKQSPETKGT